MAKNADTLVAEADTGYLPKGRVHFVDVHRIGQLANAPHRAVTTASYGVPEAKLAAAVLPRDVQNASDDLQKLMGPVLSAQSRIPAGAIDAVERTIAHACDCVC